ncbi:MAG: 5-formyltetrahydrofolate cyclo-ligase [Gallionellaceae bacterium]|nr:MAG: 5-formyltetrahydrofolate cyclo-ligase [Gallionellaceae bacterium]
MSVQTIKQGIRKAILAQREQLSAEARAAYSAAITGRLRQMPEYRQADAVLGYINFGAEFESEMLVRQALTDGKVLLLPKVNLATRELDLYRVEDVDAQLAPGAYRIREPVAGCCARQDALERIDFILLPGVAFGRDGARLGYGGGFFDKLLARMAHRPVLVAGAYSMQLAAGIPMEATDRRIDWLVTESETIRCVSD